MKLNVYTLWNTLKKDEISPSPSSRISNVGDKGVHKIRLRGKDLQLPTGVYAAAECRDLRNERTFVQLVLKT